MDRRTLVHWRRNDPLKIAKQVAGVIMRLEAVSKIDLYTKRFPELFPLIFEKVKGYKMTFRELKDCTFEEQGKKITPQKLWGRGDAVNRKGYDETDEFTAPVAEAYLELTGAKIQFDSRERFTDQEVMIAATRQGKKCANPTCRAEFTSLNPPVGDHAIARAHGGQTTQDNCKALCTSCNLRKGTLPFDEFVAKCAMTNSNGRVKLGKILEQR